MSECPRCEDQRVAHTSFCLNCGPAASGETASRRLVDIRPNAADEPRVVALLRALTDEPEDNLRLVAGLSRFGLEIDLTSAQQERLSGLLTACGLAVQFSERGPPDETQSLRWKKGSLLPLKAAVTVAIGAATAGFGVPLVPQAAAMTLALTVARSVKMVPHRLEAARSSVEKALEVIEPALLAEAATTLRALSDEPARRAVRGCLDAFAELAWIARADGAHLARPDLARVEKQLARLLRQTFKLAGSYERVFPRDDASDDAARKVLAVRGDLLRRLQETEQGLGKLGRDAREKQGEGAALAALGESTRALSGLQVNVEAAIELAEMTARSFAPS